MYINICVCVCVREREREREGGSEYKLGENNHSLSILCDGKYGAHLAVMSMGVLLVLLTFKLF